MIYKQKTNFRLPPILRVLNLLKWNPEGSGGLVELKKNPNPVFSPKYPLVQITKLLKSGSFNKIHKWGPEKGAPTLKKGQAHFQTWAYFSPMICGKYPTNNLYPNTFIKKYRISPEWTQFDYPWGVRPPN
jgi:hypothetical protein